MKILAVSACPTGIAHSYMAAEAIEVACKRAGVEYKVETQGSLGNENVITMEDVATADVCILTTDMPIHNRQRFDGLAIVEVSVNQAVRNADAVVKEAIEAIK